MASKVTRLSAGSVQLLRGLAREPRLITDLPKWIADARVRKDPLEFRTPWWNYRAIEFVERRLPGHARVFEFGGGASTLWLRDHQATVTTVEDDRHWYEGLRQRLPDADLRFVELATNTVATPDGPFDNYAHSIDGEPDETFDLVIVDGQARHDSILAAAPKVRRGGMLLLDDSQWSDTEPPTKSNLARLRRLYADLPQELAGWQVHHLRGMKPGTWLPVQTSVWIKP